MSRKPLKIEKSSLADGLTVFQRDKYSTRGRPKIVKVAAYCRVSTDKEEQKSSLENQLAAYEEVVFKHRGWKLVKTYTDEGITGTSTKRRIGFNEMIEDAEKGKINYIIAKSTSRFARNTVDTLYYTRYLREMGVGVYFEEQNLDTMNLSSEMILTVHAAFAQEESHSISENTKVGIRNRFEMGIPKWVNIYGLKRTAEDKWEPDEKTAPIVRKMFELTLEGLGAYKIAKWLNKEKIPTPTGKGRWYEASVVKILRNEKYVGDVEMQKVYTVDHLTHRKVRNKDATVTKYYLENHHEPIVDRDTFNMVQMIMSVNNTREGSIQFPFYGFVKCPYCGENMVGASLFIRTKEQGWTCGGKEGHGILRSERTECPEYFIRVKYLHRAVIDGFNSIKKTTLKKIGTEAAAFALKYKEKEMPEKVSYYFLYKLVESITFAKTGEEVDFDRLVVRWKLGFETEYHVEYDRATDIPVTYETAKYYGRRYYANGKETNGQIAGYRAILNLLDFCKKIRIIDSEKEVATNHKRVNIPSVYPPEKESA